MGNHWKKLLCARRRQSSLRPHRHRTTDRSGIHEFEQSCVITDQLSVARTHFAVVLQRVVNDTFPHGNAAITAMNWRDHSCLFYRDGSDKTCTAKAELHAMIAIAMTISQGLEHVSIVTDAGQMLCHREIAYAAMLADRPK